MSHNPMTYSRPAHLWLARLARNGRDYRPVSDKGSAAAKSAMDAGLTEWAEAKHKFQSCGEKLTSDGQALLKHWNNVKPLKKPNEQ